MGSRSYWNRALGKRVTSQLPWEILPAEIAKSIYANFPKPGDMHLLSSPGKIKFKYRHFEFNVLFFQFINQIKQLIQRLIFRSETGKGCMFFTVCNVFCKSNHTTVFLNPTHEPSVL